MFKNGIQRVKKKKNKKESLDHLIQREKFLHCKVPKSWGSKNTKKTVIILKVLFAVL